MAVAVNKDTGAISWIYLGNATPSPYFKGVRAGAGVPGPGGIVYLSAAPDGTTWTHGFETITGLGRAEAVIYSLDSNGNPYRFKVNYRNLAKLILFVWESGANC
jgi:hypothetical protein